MLMMRTQKRMKHSSCNNMNNDTELMDLPIEILINILLRLPVNSLRSIQSVSKAFLDMVDDLSFVTLHTHRLLSSSSGCTSNVPRQVPRLMLLIESSKGKGNITHPLIYHGDNTTLRKIKHGNIFGVWSRLPYILSFAFCNLFLFRGKISSKAYLPFLLDPLKGEVLMLPAANNTGLSCQCDSYGMGFDSLTNNFKVVHISQHTNEKPAWNKMVKMVSVAEVLVLGTSSWREIYSVLPPCLRFSNEIASAYGDTHWLVLRPNEYSTVQAESNLPSILSFDFKKEEFYWTPHPTLEKKSGTSLALFHLLNLRGSLALVDGSSDIHMEIWELKNYDKKEWVLSYKIDMKHPFRNLHVSACGEWEHGIFFQDTCYDHTNRSIFFLDLTCISMNLAKLEGSKYYKRIFTCTESLMSLRNYGDLVEAKQATEISPSIETGLKLEKQAGKIFH
ncbi:F-box protein [Pyrus ussuriensis x Pyrus communis]|uniref:F-box protein n=1 Tax=Pyrus ussuriensis x Pyrus communis TaxID=2448454 RepID=A0A5N5EYZ7_9ROSA|nr:F-box protein [Pyrus ussuriensis x Pyrus communis]